MSCLATRESWDAGGGLGDAPRCTAAEYLAYLLHEELTEGDPAEVEAARHRVKTRADAVLEAVQAVHGAQRYAEGYTKGVHDADAALILAALVEMHGSVPACWLPRRRTRALAGYWWATAWTTTTRATGDRPAGRASARRRRPGCASRPRSSGSTSPSRPDPPRGLLPTAGLDGSDAALADAAARLAYELTGSPTA